MTGYGTRAQGAPSRALIDAVERVLDAQQWRAEGTAWGIDWHDERAAARVALRPGLLVVYRRGERVAYIENPRAAEVEGALMRARVVSPSPAASAAGRARVPHGARAEAGAPWAGARGRGSGGS